MGDAEGEGIELRPAELEGVTGDEVLVTELDEEDDRDTERARPLAEGMMIGSVRFGVPLSLKLIL
jgi:hypothetical protein